MLPLLLQQVQYTHQLLMTCSTTGGPICASLHVARPETHKRMLLQAARQGDLHTDGQPQNGGPAASDGQGQQQQHNMSADQSMQTDSSSRSSSACDDEPADDATSAGCIAPMASEAHVQPPHADWTQWAPSFAAASPPPAALQQLVPAAQQLSNTFPSGMLGQQTAALQQLAPAAQKSSSTFQSGMLGQQTAQAVGMSAAQGHASMLRGASLQPVQLDPAVPCPAGHTSMQQATPSSVAAASPAALPSSPVAHQINPQGPLSVSEAFASEVRSAGGLRTEHSVAAWLPSQLVNSSSCPDSVPPAGSRDQAQPLMQTWTSAAAAGLQGAAPAYLPDSSAAVANHQPSQAGTDSLAAAHAVTEASSFVLQSDDTTEHAASVGLCNPHDNWAGSDAPSQVVSDPPSLLKATLPNDDAAAVPASHPSASASLTVVANPAASAPSALHPTSPPMVEAASAETLAAVHAACVEQQHEKDPQDGHDALSVPNNTAIPQAAIETAATENLRAAADAVDASTYPEPGAGKKKAENRRKGNIPVHQALAEPPASCEPAEPAEVPRKKRRSKGQKRRASSASVGSEAAEDSPANPGISQGEGNTAQAQSGTGLRQSSLADAAQPSPGGKRRRFVVKPAATAPTPWGEDTPPASSSAGCVQAAAAGVREQRQPGSHVQPGQAQPTHQGSEVVVEAPLEGAAKDAAAAEVSEEPVAAVLRAISQASRAAQRGLCL